VAGGLCLAVAAVLLLGRHRLSPVEAAEQEFRLGAADEGDGLFQRALEHYRASVARAPASRPARSARARVAWIEQRAEGGFLPLATLARVRRDPTSLADPSLLSRLTAETETFPSGLVRSELRLRIGEAWLRLGSHRADGVAELRALVSDPTSGAADRKLAERDLEPSVRPDRTMNRSVAVTER
jgi:hypothetical protein